jgi:hypothetical protein
MRRAVWSFWSGPWHHRQGAWPSPTHHLLSWVLSVETARRHYPLTSLVTDDDGAAMLVDGIGLEFDEVSTELNQLAGADPGWWSLGKLHAYRAQEAPFVHIDSDCFLWQRLPERIETADVFGQSPETFSFDDPPAHYRPELVLAAIDSVNGWAPHEFRWFTDHRGGWAVNCGILGGTNTDFIRHYADGAVRLIRHPANQPAWDLLGDRTDHSVLVEQYLLAACAEYARGQADSPFHGTTLDHLFTSPGDPFDPGRAQQAGYTHLIASSKRDRDTARRLVARAAADYPELAERCDRYARAQGEEPLAAILGAGRG